MKHKPMWNTNIFEECGTVLCRFNEKQLIRHQLSFAVTAKSNKIQLLLKSLLHSCHSLYNTAAAFSIVQLVQYL